VDLATKHVAISSARKIQKGCLQDGQHVSSSKQGIWLALHAGVLDIHDRTVATEHEEGTEEGLVHVQSETQQTEGSRVEEFPGGHVGRV
jgi:hypothetical protein